MKIDASELFSVGQVVVSTEDGDSVGHFPVGVTGVVLGYSRDRQGVRVLVDGYKTDNTYHVAKWRPFAAADVRRAHDPKVRQTAGRRHRGHSEP